MTRQSIPWDLDRLSRREAADFLGVAVSTLEVWACTGRYDLPYVRVGRRVFYRRSDLEAFVAQRTVTNPHAFDSNSDI